jgi:hypothetical protein
VRNEFSTDNIWFATVLVYLGYTLLKIETSYSSQSILLKVQSEDARILQEEFDSEQGLPLANANQFCQTFARLTARVRDTRKAGGVYTSPAYAQSK